MMQRDVVPLGGTVLGVGLLGQAQEESLERFPIWIWILLAAVVIAVAVIWTLREQGEEAAGTEAEAQPATPAAPAEAEVAPSPEPATPAPEAVEEVEVPEGPEVPEVAEVVEETPAAATAASAATAAAVSEVVEEPEPAEAPEAAASAATAAAAAAAEETPPVAPPPSVEPDDLKVVEGIGPKISGVLQAAGISTFAQLANTDVERLRQILVDADLTRLADPGTWPEQAALAAAGDWDGLEAFQDSLEGGRRT